MRAERGEHGLCGVGAGKACVEPAGDAGQGVEQRVQHAGLHWTAADGVEIGDVQRIGGAVR